MKRMEPENNPVTKRIRSCLYAVLAGSLFMSQSATAVTIPTPTYDVTGTDATWTDTGSGVYTVPTSAEDYANEIWERPVQDNNWSDSGGTRTSTGEYWAYVDLEAGGWGIDANYLYVSWTVVGDYKDDGGTKTSEGLLGHYYFYTKDSLGTVFGVEIAGGDAKDFTDTFGDSPGKVKLWDGSNSTVSGEARATGSTVEVAILLTDFNTFLGRTLTAADLANSYLGVAKSNPSAFNTDLYANENFAEAIGSGVEYDTMLLTSAVPVPAAVWLFGSGLIGLVGMARRKKA